MGVMQINQKCTHIKVLDMNKDNIYKTPESDLSIENNGVLEFAGFWVRVIASIIDTIMIMIITLPLLYLVYGAAIWESGSMVNGFWDVIISYILPAVIVVLFWCYKSATPGKMILGLKVISLGDSEKLSVGQSVGRYIGYFPAMFIFMLGIIWVAFDKNKQGWHDKLANTAVVKKGYVNE